MILVTGGTGFLGSHLLAKLASEGENVIAVKRSSSSLQNVERVFEFYKIAGLTEKIEWRDCDILDYKTLYDLTAGIEKVYHLAATVSFRKKDSKKMLLNNIKGSENIINACISNGVKRICFVSSITALGTTTDGSPVDETTQWNSRKSNSAYSVSKYYSELQAWRGFYEGLGGVIVCPSVIIGPGGRNNGINMLFDVIDSKIRICPAGSNGFVDVRDVAELMILLMKREDINREKFLVSGYNASYKDLLEKTAMLAGRHVTFNEVSLQKLRFYSFLMRAGNMAGNSYEAPGSQLIRLLATRYAYSNKKIKETLGYDFTGVEETLTEVLNYNRRQ